MVETRELEKSEWAEMLERISRQLEEGNVMIEVDALGIGGQIEADHARLLGLSYDPKGDTVQMSLAGVEHMIQKPVTIYVAFEGTDLIALQVVDAAGAQHILNPEKPLALPA